MNPAPVLYTTTDAPASRRRRFGQLVGASPALLAAEIAAKLRSPLLVLAEDPRHADQLEAEIRFFAGDSLSVLHFVEWETLPWDSFSPHQDIVSDRLRVLRALPDLERGIVIASAPALLQRLPPTHYVAERSLELRSGQTLDRNGFIQRLADAGYLRVPQVTEHGEYAVRGSLIDLFPMGNSAPLRIDFFDDEIETIISPRMCGCLSEGPACSHSCGESCQECYESGA